MDGDIEQEVLVQGTSYKETGGTVDAVPEGTAEPELVDEGQHTFFKGSKEKPDDKDGESNNNKIILIIAAIVVVLIASIFLYVYFDKKAKAEEQARLEALLQEEVDVPVTYTNEEIEGLRLAGYTGDEIEAFEYEEVSAQSLIEEAEADRKALYDKEVAPYFDMATDEFKEVYSNTWLGQSELTFSSDATQYMYYSEVMNVDYEKLPPKGHQLFIKFYLTNGDACFTTVTPERYVEMASVGNIVLEIKYTQTVDGSRIITGITEIQP